MAKLSNHQILDLAYEVGWRKAGDLERVLAVVLAESGGNTEAVSNTGCCHGLMQINVRVHRQYTAAQMKDARQNMQAGFALWRQSGWAPWNSSRGGQLLRGPEARASTATWHASPGVGSQGVGGAIGEAAAGAAGAIPGFAEVGDALNRTVQWITTPANIGRAVMVGAGVVLVIAALIRVAPIPTPNAIAKVLK
jgi:Lysozyme like domain